MEKVRTLLFLDSIMDTRLSTVERCNPEWAKNIIEQGYQTRLTNRFSYLVPTVNDKFINDMWNKRNVKTVMAALPTQLLYMLAEKRKENELIGIDHPRYCQMEVTLNIWPYRLNALEINSFKTCLQELLMTNEVTVINRDIKMCSPIWIRESFDNVYFFDMNEWLVIHAQNLDRNKAPDTVFTFPLCFLDEVDPNGKNPKEVIDYMTLALSKHFTVDVLPLSCFSIQQ